MKNIHPIILFILISVIGCKKGKNMLDGTYKYTNALIHESSPYLLQHAHNPVDWYPWSEEALDKAKKENKLLIISVGYAACHWCHVMEHESFEDSTVAKIMNDNFVCIKVDREERPDIDDVYMSACQLVSQRGCGWPLNSFALPDGRPVWAGTYFPKEQWINVLQQFVKIKKEDPKRLEESADNIAKGIASMDKDQMIDVSNHTIDKEFIQQFGLDIIGNIDMVHGGSRGAPKFPMPNMIDFLLKYYHFQKDERALIAARVTLDEMAKGGIFDQVGGGFSRYSVDSVWLVPHFEKMLYDNGQLLTTYANGYRLLKSPLYKTTIEKTVDFMKNELLSKEGAFFSSLDADSEKEEGKYYVWSKAEVDSLFVDKTKATIFCSFFDITEHGNWEEKNILRQTNKNSVLVKYKISEANLERIVHDGVKVLYEARKKRVRPGTDDKVLTSWNGLAIKGLTDAYLALGTKEYLDLAQRTANFVVDKQMEKDGRLYRNYKNGKSTINGFLDDYATSIEAFISLYQADFDDAWLYRAERLADYVIANFSDDNSMMFFYTSKIDAPLIARKKEITDNVISSSNSIMARNLNKLGELLSRQDFLDRSQNMGKSVIEMLKKSRQPTFYANWCSHYLDIAQPPYEVAILGEDATSINHEIQKEFSPNAVFLGGRSEGKLELLKDKLREGETTIYVCQNKVCKMPVSTAQDALKLMK